MPSTPMAEIPVIHETLRANFKKGVARSLEWRKDQVLQLARMVQDNDKAFAAAIARDMNKPSVETYFVEIGNMVSRCLQSAAGLDEWAKPVEVEAPDWQKPWRPTIHKGAKGTVLIISPWNYPLVLSLHPLLGAIAAGCCAVVKPSEVASHYAELLAELFPKYMDQNAYRVILGGVPETTKVLELQWDHIFYTGNGRIARIVATAAARHLTPLTLELGGKSPVIVDPAYDIALAAKRILWGKSQNCGQLCVAPDYVLIPRAHQDAFIEALKASYNEFFPEGSLKSSSMSNIINPHHHARVMDLVKRTKGQVALGGGTMGTEKIEITVLRDVAGNDSTMEEEIFGPILPIVPVDTLEDAIEFVRERDHPLAFYVFSQDPKIKKLVLETTMSGAVAFNDTFQQLAVDLLPFGGVGASGYGSQTLKYTFEEFSYARATIDVPKEAEPFNAARYAPYNDEKFKVMTAGAFLGIPKRG
ncbi:aldehyde dehydrogenase [Mycena rebaudengoi]|nr:aldehyde dehydrogenase [Mycena rebaudengoi]